MMNYNHLYYFYVIAKFQNISLAARHLKTSQPSLSAQIKTFESALGKKLFEKKGRHIQMTLDGEKVFQYCQKMFSISEDLQKSLNKDIYIKAQKIRVGISEQIEQPFAADLLSPTITKSKKSQSTFLITSSSDDELIRQFKSEELDILIMNKPIYGIAGATTTEMSIPVVLLGSTRLLEGVRCEYPSNYSFESILSKLDFEWVIPTERQKLRHEIDLFMQKFSIKRPISLESDILSVVARAILDGAGIGFLPLSYVEEEIKMNALKIIGSKRGYWTHTIFIKSRV